MNDGSFRNPLTGGEPWAQPLSKLIAIDEVNDWVQRVIEARGDAPPPPTAHVTPPAYIRQILDTNEDIKKAFSLSSQHVYELRREVMREYKSKRYGTPPEDA